MFRRREFTWEEEEGISSRPLFTLNSTLFIAWLFCLLFHTGNHDTPVHQFTMFQSSLSALYLSNYCVGDLTRTPDCGQYPTPTIYAYSQSASPIQHTVNLVFGYKVFLKVYFNVKIYADFKSVCSQTQNVERFAKSMF